MEWNYERSAIFIAHLQAISGLSFNSNMGQLMNQAKRIALQNKLDVETVYERLIEETKKLDKSNFDPLADLIKKQ